MSDPAGQSDQPSSRSGQISIFITEIDFLNIKIYFLIFTLSLDYVPSIFAISIFAFEHILFICMNSKKGYQSSFNVL